MPTTKARTSNKMLGSCSKKRYRTWTELSRNQAGRVELQRVIDIGQQVTTRRRVKNQNKHKLNSEAEKKTHPTYYKRIRTDRRKNEISRPRA